MGDNSLMPYYKNIGLQVIIMILFLIGGIGYPVIHDVVNYIRIKSINKNAYYNWSLFTKISVVTYLISYIVWLYFCNFIWIIIYWFLFSSLIYSTMGTMHTKLDHYYLW
nr:potassium transporter TrkG [Mycoplasmopsis bovis]